MRVFKASDRNQPFLLPPSIQDWLPKEHLARFIVEIVEQLDLSRIYGQYNGRGKEAYDPQVMLSLPTLTLNILKSPYLRDFFFKMGKLATTF